ncbi:MAG: sulfatase [Verrucomicrobiota bacterium]
MSHRPIRTSPGLLHSFSIPILFATIATLGSATAAVFDFSQTGTTSANNSQNSGAGNVNIVDASVASVTPTVNGIQLTLTAASTSGTATLGANSQGFGVSTNSESNPNDTRLEGDKGESIRFSFDAQVSLTSLRLGNFANGEIATLSFVSGTNPFTNGTSLTITANGNQGPATDILLASSPIVTGGLIVIEAGTVLELKVSGGDSDLLLNEFTVSLPGATTGTTIESEFPTPTLAENRNPGTNVATTTIAAGNSKGQSFSLPAASTASAFVFECAGVSTPGTFQLQLFRAMDDKPWMLTPVATGTYSLPSGLVASDLFRINLAAPVALSRGSYFVSLTGVGSTNFSVSLSNAPLFPTGAGAQNNSTAGWQPFTNSDADLVFAVLGTGETPTPAPVGKPNIVFILADDLGWTDVQCGSTGPNVIKGVNYGSSYYQTPNLTRLAQEGLSFTHAFVHPNCAPSRAALISGQYPSRPGNGVYHVVDLNRGVGTPFYSGPTQNEDIPPSHVIWSEALQQGGYVTAHLGKYHLANHEAGAAALPENQGFDYNFGGNESGTPGNYFAINETWDNKIGPGLAAYASSYTAEYVAANLAPLANGNDPTTLIGTDKHITDAMGDAATAFIRDHQTGNLADRPFFMQVHFYAVHTPIQPRPDLRAKYNSLPTTATHKDAQYAALVQGMDQNVGRILDRLSDPNGDGNMSDSIAANTLVVFLSDNGGHIGETDNDPLRHQKGAFWNGGLRVPMIVRQPGVVPAATQTDTLVHAVDFYPTFLERAGIALPPGIPFDGESFANHITDPAANPRDRSPIFYHFPGYLDQRARPVDVAIARINGEDYKLIYNYDLNYTGNPSSGEDVSEGLKVISEPWELYRFSSDISETHDLFDGSYSNQLLYGDIAASMAGDLNAWLNQPDNWDATPLQIQSTGAPVPYPPAEVPQVTVPLAQTFRILSSLPDGTEKNVTLSWRSENGFTYDIEASSELEAWEKIATGIDATGTTTSATVPDPNMNSSTKRFYRVVLTR